MNKTSGQNGDIMIVDDNPANLKLLEEMLQLQGHIVRSFPLGRLALAASLKNPPDLILLDINMPEMDGYEVCKHLKDTPESANIPVIFLSALNDTSDKVKAFQSGAADYITKPFQMEEVHSRVRTHLDLHSLETALRQQNELLEAAVAARTQELSAANARLTILDRSKNDFLKLISHEFRTPLNGLLGVSEIILEEMPGTADGQQLRQLYQRSRSRILTILDDAFLLTQIDVEGLRFKTAAIPLHLAMASAVDGTAEFARSRQVTLIPVTAATELFAADSVLAHHSSLARALEALLETAIKSSERGTSVQIHREITPVSLNVKFESCGPTLPDLTLEKFFDILAIAQPLTPGGDLGLRPAVAQRILALFGAAVSVANRDQSGILLTISFLKDHDQPLNLFSAPSPA